MKKLLFKLLKYLIIILLLMASALALSYHFSIPGKYFIMKINELKSQDRREEAQDLAKFFIENNTGDVEGIKEIESTLEYTSTEKLKSFFKGAIKGEIHDTYSGIGAISSDLCIYGDVRDLAIQSWRYLKNEETDAIVAALSGIGIILSGKPFADILASFSKNTIKYLKRVSSLTCNNGILKKVSKGTLSIAESKQIFQLLKKTNFPYPELQHFYQMSAV